MALSEPCPITCIFSAVVVVGMFFMTKWMSVNDTAKNYKKQLPESLKKTYSEIVQDRTQIFYTGYMLGILFALVLIFYNVRIRKNRMKWPSMVCLTVAVAFITNYFYYILTPKKKWMLDSITTPEQTKAWLQMYKRMQMYYHGSLVIGLISVGLITFAFRCE